MNANAYHADNALLATGEWLVPHLSDPDIRIVDTRKDDNYVTSHIPGAVALGVAPYLRENGDVLGPDAFGRLMSKLGIESDTTVIAYDDGNNLFAARLWWVLNYYGHARVKVLNGGWDNWIAQNRPIQHEAVVPEQKQFAAHPHPGWIATTDYVQASIDRDDRVIFDVRSDEEWSRVEQASATLPGHIPGAVHLVWSDVVDRATMRFKPLAELQRMFADRGVTPDKEIIPYCQGGIRAAHSLFALRLAGFERVRNYEGSWVAWSKAGLPVEAARK
jgi:thiosulfate/3-mercaptopyruvate sulfurtransferase